MTTITTTEQELLEALEHLMGLVRDMSNVYDDNGANWIMSQKSWVKAQAAIAKAKGGRP